ncbi:MAG: dipeptidase [Planctomycetaceae bacterium]
MSETIDRRRFLSQSSAMVAGAVSAGRVGNTTAFADDKSTRAAALHSDSLVFIIHDHNPVLADVDRMRAGGVTAKGFQILVDVVPGREFQKSAAVFDGWTQMALDSIHTVRKEIASAPDKLLLALNADDILRAKREGKIAILLGVEGAKLLEGRIENLKMFYDLGLRELQLRWAVPNQVVMQNDLTAFGVEVVRECQKLGIIVDVTHIPERAFDQTMELMESPPIVSHGSAARVRTDLSDHRIKAIAARKGVIGIHFYSSYLGPNPTVERVIDNIDAMVQVGGIETVGLGVDYFPTDGAWKEFQAAQGSTGLTWAVEHIGKMGQVTDALVKRNYSDDEIRKILGGNYLRVCREVFQG